MSDQEHNIWKAMTEVAVEKAIAAIKAAQNYAAKPKLRAKLNEALKELLRVVPDEQTVVSAIREAEKRGYTGDELVRAKQRLESVRRCRTSKKKMMKKGKKKSMKRGVTKKRAVVHTKRGASTTATTSRRGSAKSYGKGAASGGKYRR